MSDIIPTNNELAETWKWRTSIGEFIRPADMETRHLFYTLRMIWNHHAPAGYKLMPYRGYSHFGSFYTPEYLQKAIKYLMVELRKRDNIPYEWVIELEKMIAWSRELFSIKITEEGK